MEKTIVISELIRGEHRSRTEAKKIYIRAKDLNSPCVRIDFKDVYFMSRSFADELCNTIEALALDKVRVSMENENDSIDLMMKIVKGNRNKPRNMHEDSEVKEFSDMDSLSEFLSTI